ncbi:MAG: tetratricopeptide repeat protein, partial [bacterium]|nr:tetratricopeptide repeat protein [bacterium]
MYMIVRVKVLVIFLIMLFSSGMVYGADVVKDFLDRYIMALSKEDNKTKYELVKQSPVDAISALDRLVGFYFGCEIAGDLSNSVVSISVAEKLAEDIDSVLKVGFYRDIVRMYKSWDVKQKQKKLKSLEMIIEGQELSRVGEYIGALERFNQAKKICEELGDKQGVSIVLTSIGGIYYVLGEYDKALSYYDESLSIAREIKDKQVISVVVLNSIGGIY